MIVHAVNRTPTQVYVYDEKGRVINTITGVLQGYTSNSVTVRRNPQDGVVYVYMQVGPNRWKTEAVRGAR